MVESMGPALGHFTGWVMGWVLRLGSVAAVVWFGITALKVIMHGGHGRAVWELLVGLGVVVILVAAVADWQGTFGLAQQLGAHAWAAIKGELAAGLS